MLKTLLAATTALALMSGAGFAETSYSSSDTTRTVNPPEHNVDVTKTTRETADRNGLTVEKHKTVTRDTDRDHMVAEKEKKTWRDPDGMRTGEVSHSKTESTTVRGR